jgi:hypothetical protein
MILLVPKSVLENPLGQGEVPQAGVIYRLKKPYVQGPAPGAVPASPDPNAGRAT